MISLQENNSPCIKIGDCIKLYKMFIVWFLNRKSHLYTQVYTWCIWFSTGHHHIVVHLFMIQNTVHHSHKTFQYVSVTLRDPPPGLLPVSTSSTASAQRELQQTAFCALQMTFPYKEAHCWCEKLGLHHAMGTDEGQTKDTKSVIPWWLNIHLFWEW